LTADVNAYIDMWNSLYTWV